MYKELDDETIHRLVFETFGIRRYTQDSPIQPDVWVWLLKLAARGELKRRISLILTPKETPGKDGRPPGGAAPLAEKIRASILGREGATRTAMRKRQRSSDRESHQRSQQESAGRYSDRHSSPHCKDFQDRFDRPGMS